MERERENDAERAADETVVPVIEEEAVAGTRRVKTGSVRVDKEARKQVRKLRAPLIHDDVEVRRVPVHKVVEEAPRVRTVGSTIIVPVVEEELVVTKRLVVKEEIHLIQRRTKRQVTKAVEVVREHARVRRLDPEGRVIDPEADHPTPGRGKPWRSVLD